MNLFSRLSDTKEFITQQKEADNVQTLNRLVCIGEDALQLNQEQQLPATPREDPTEVTQVR